jgi:hypothetical protein
VGRRSNPTNLGALENLELLVVISVLVLIALSVIIYLAFQFKTRSNEIDEMTKKKWKIIEKDIMTMMIDRSTSWFLKRMGRILLISIDIWWTLTTTLYCFFFFFSFDLDPPSHSLRLKLFSRRILYALLILEVKRVGKIKTDWIIIIRVAM